MLSKIIFYIFSVHFGGGTWGVIAVAFLARDTGIVFNWDAKSGLVCRCYFYTLITCYEIIAQLSLLLTSAGQCTHMVCCHG